MPTYQYILNLLLKDNNVFAQFNKVENQVNKVNNSVNSLSQSITNKLGSVNISSLADNVERTGLAFQKLAAPGVAFEQSISDLSAITGIVGKNLDDLANTAEETGKKTGLGAAQSAEAFKLLASNIDFSKIGIGGLKELQAQAIILSQAAGNTLPEAANALSYTINQFGLKAADASRVINVMAAAAKYGASEVPDLSETFRVAGATAAGAKIPLEALAGAAEVLSQNAVKGAEGGTALRNIMLRMQTAMGVDFSKTSLSDALGALKPKLNDITYLSKVFGMENVNAAQYLIQNSAAIEEMTQKVTGTNVAQEQAAKRTETMQHKLEVMRAKIDSVKISMFEGTNGLIAYVGAAGEMMGGLANATPIFMGMKSAINWLTVAENRNRIAKAIGTAAIYTQLVAMYAWDAIVGVLTGKITLLSAATAVWNAILAVNPVVWVVMAVAALIAVIVVLVTKVQGWGKQWDHVVGMAKSGWSMFVDGVMIGIDKMQIGWYKFKNLMGLGNKGENKSMISQLNADVERRKKEISEAQTKFKQNMKWDLAWKTEVKATAGATKKQIGAAGIPGLVLPKGTTSGTTSGNAPLQGTPKTEAVAAGGARNTTVTINLGKLVETISFSGGLKEHAQDMTRQVEEALLRVLYSAQNA